MSKKLIIAATLLSSALGGCCKEDIQARAFVGHLTQEECLRNMKLPEPPISIICPGTEVTLCWGSGGIPDVQIAVDADPDGLSGTYPKQGLLYLKPQADTTVDLTGGECASDTKQIMVINGPTPATFDAHWDFSCQKISYELSTAFVDPKVQTIDVSAAWEPTLFDPATKTVTTCPTPPFLSGAHAEEVFFFEVLKPFLTVAFSRILKAPVHWDYEQKTCVGPDITCNPYASLPFNMTLVCPGQ